jgi:F-type H+-transporting ATPase subunit delta
MIREEIVSKRYADAYLAYAKETIGYDKGIDELQRVKRIIRDNQDFRDFLDGREITNTEKASAIDNIFKTDFEEETRQFLKLLIDKKRIDLVVDIAEYARIHYAHGVELDALLKTSYPLETETIARIKDSLEKRMHRKLHLYIQLDADLVGGASARIGNIIIDGSIKKRLEDMKEKLHALKVV